MPRPASLPELAPSLGRLLRRFWPYLREERRVLAGSFAALAAEVALRLLEPWPLKLVLDHLLRPGAAPEFGLSPHALLGLAALAVVLLAGLRAWAAFRNTIGLAFAANRMLARVRGDVYRHLQRLSLRFHGRARNGDLTVCVTNDVNLLQDVTVSALLPLLGDSLLIVGMLGLMLWVQWELALLALALLPLFWLRAVRLSRRIHAASRVQRRREGALAATAAESIGAIRVVQALSLEGRFAEEFQGQNARSLRDGVQARRLSAGLERSVDVLAALATALVLWFGAGMALRGTLSPGELVVFLSYLKSAFKPLKDFAKYTARLAKAVAAGERVLAILDETPEICDRPDAGPAPRLRGALEFDGVHFAYEPGHPVLAGVSLALRPGETLAVVGPSGAGKSTLLSLLLRLIDPAAGSVRLDGTDLRRYTLASLRAQVGTVLQDNLLFGASVRENLALGRAGASDTEIEAAARLANAHGFISALPDGYDTVVGERGATLSAGQRQRIAIARAALRDARLLLLDEPTTGLDEENRWIVAQALERLAEGRTTLLVTHDLPLAARAHRVAYLEGGQVLGCAPHAELLRGCARYAAFVRHATLHPPREVPHARSA